jgi:hypothetical protein
VRSIPKKADVWLDGKKVGITPFPKTVAGGSHSLVLKKAGWADYAQDIEVRASRPQTLTLKMNAPNAQTETDQLGNNELLKEKPENTLLQEEPASTPHVQNQSSNYRYSILSTVLTVAAVAVGGYFSAMETVSYSLYQDA